MENKENENVVQEVNGEDIEDTKFLKISVIKLIISGILFLFSVYHIILGVMYIFLNTKPIIHPCYALIISLLSVFYMLYTAIGISEENKESQRKVFLKFVAVILLVSFILGVIIFGFIKGVMDKAIRDYEIRGRDNFNIYQAEEEDISEISRPILV